VLSLMSMIVARLEGPGLEVAVVARADAGHEVCPFCHGPLAARAQRACEACGTPHHDDCLGEHGGCTALGCRAAPARDRVR
jgi:hypothetical protein